MKKTIFKWPEDWATSNGDFFEEQKSIYITPNLQLRITMNQISEDGVTPEPCFWPEVIWNPNEDPITVYLESYNPVDSEIEAIKILEKWFDNFYFQMSNSKSFKNSEELTSASQ